jgi:hypothetical protein
MSNRVVTYIDINLNSVEEYWNALIVPSVKKFQTEPVAVRPHRLSRRRRARRCSRILADPPKDLPRRPAPAAGTSPRLP